MRKDGYFFKNDETNSTMMTDVSLALKPLAEKASVSLKPVPNPAIWIGQFSTPV
jgi:hypothetical protein